MDRTNAERQRRYITRLKAAAAQKPAQHEAAAERIAALEVENAALKAEVARLKAAAADTQQRQSRKRPRTDWAALKAQATAARKAKRAEAKAARLAAAAAERPDADVPTLLAENDTLQRQLKAARTEIKNLKAELRYFTNLRGTIFTPDLEKKIRVCLHPDWVTDPKQQRRYNETLAEFNAVIDATKKQRRA